MTLCGIRLCYFHSNKVQSTLCGQGSGNHGLAAAWWTIEQNTTRRRDAEPGKRLVRKRQS